MRCLSPRAHLVRRRRRPPHCMLGSTQPTPEAGLAYVLPVRDVAPARQGADQCLSHWYWYRRPVDAR
jgi:hypothetical protein